MRRDELRAIQAPIKETYRRYPAAASITLRAEGELSEGVTCSVETGRALVRAGLHPGTGGDGLSACSGDMLLQALAACAGVTLRAVSTSMGLTISRGTVVAEGDLDWRGTLGVDRNVNAGFQRIRVSFELETDATDDEVATLLRLTERYCVVFQTLASKPEMTASATRREG